MKAFLNSTSSRVNGLMTGSSKSRSTNLDATASRLTSYLFTKYWWTLRMTSFNDKRLKNDKSTIKYGAPLSIHKGQKRNDIHSFLADLYRLSQESYSWLLQRFPMKTEKENSNIRLKEREVGTWVLDFNCILNNSIGYSETGWPYRLR